MLYHSSFPLAVCYYGARKQRSGDLRMLYEIMLLLPARGMTLVAHCRVLHRDGCFVSFFACHPQGTDTASKYRLGVTMRDGHSHVRRQAAPDACHVLTCHPQPPTPCQIRCGPGGFCSLLVGGLPYDLQVVAGGAHVLCWALPCVRGARWLLLGQGKVAAAAVLVGSA